MPNIVIPRTGSFLMYVQLSGVAVGTQAPHRSPILINVRAGMSMHRLVWSERNLDPTGAPNGTRCTVAGSGTAIAVSQWMFQESCAQHRVARLLV